MFYHLCRLREEERAGVMSDAKNVLFNLNTIEGIMLVSTIMINLAGIMLLSGQFENLEPDEEFQRDIITYIIIIVISASFFILFCSLVREIRLARQLSKNMAKGKWRAVIRKQIAINNKKRKTVKRFQDVVYQVMRRHGIGKKFRGELLANTFGSAPPARKKSMFLAHMLHTATDVVAHAAHQATDVVTHATHHRRASHVVPVPVMNQEQALILAAGLNYSSCKGDPYCRHYVVITLHTTK
jgi:hypothetical protein